MIFFLNYMQLIKNIDKKIFIHGGISLAIHMGIT